MEKPIIVSGIQPSGLLHVGNYLGALGNFVYLQNTEKYDCYFFVADLHSLTEPKHPNIQKENIENLLVEFSVAGLNEKSTIFIQSLIPEHAELAWIFNTITPMGELERMTQYKDKVSRGISASAGLFDYPVLMAADILIYKTNLVPVGDDQDQHLELARTIARNFNKKFGEFFPEPKAHHTKTSRIMSLDDPSKKMSKSSPKGCLFLTDSPETIKQKTARAVTDSKNKIEYNPQKNPGISNLLFLWGSFEHIQNKNSDPVIGAQTIANNYKDKSYAEFKKDLSAYLITNLQGFRDGFGTHKTQNLHNLIEKSKLGSEKARQTAQKTLLEVKQKIGLSLS